MIQATNSQPGEPTCRDISAETRKMPEPIIEPATIVVESSSPRPRMNPVFLSSTAMAASAILSSSESYQCLYVVLKKQQKINKRQNQQNDRDHEARSGYARLAFVTAFTSGSQRSPDDDRAEHQR